MIASVAQQFARRATAAPLRGFASFAKDTASRKFAWVSGVGAVAFAGGVAACETITTITVTTGGKTETSVSSPTTEAALASASQNTLPLEGAPGTKQERTLILVKPDGVERCVVGAVISKFELKGYKLVGMKMVWASKEKAEENYAGLKSKPFFPGLVNYFSSGPIVCMCWEGKDVIKTGREMVDEVRGTFAADRGRNCCDGSDSVEGAKAELARWFSVGDIHEYERAIDKQIYA